MCLIIISLSRGRFGGTGGLAALNSTQDILFIYNDAALIKTEEYYKNLLGSRVGLVRLISRKFDQLQTCDLFWLEN